jgi:predicted Zn-dependent peptidase
MYTINTLSSGLPVITAPLSGTESVTVLVFAGAGSRYEANNERGISHFLEHMFFKGGNKYRTTKDVSAAIDGIGGSFNAFTGKEYAGYYVKVAKEDVETAFDVLSDMLLHASFPQEEIEKERGVIIEEERMYQDTPMYRAGWDFELLLYGDQPLGWDTIGTEEVIQRVNQADFSAHKQRLYTPDNCVISIAGNITVEQATHYAEQYFGALGGTKGAHFTPFTGYSTESVLHSAKSTEQSHLVLGVPGVPHEDERYVTKRILSTILGGTMSSRMFLNIREAMGMCYYISTETDAYLDAGALSTRAGVDQARLPEAIAAIMREYKAVATDGVTDEELERAKSYFKGRLKLGLEDTEERAHFYGKQLLLYKHIDDIADFVAAVDSITKNDVNTLAKELLTPEAMKLTVIGSRLSKDELQNLLVW